MGSDDMLKCFDGVVSGLCIARSREMDIRLEYWAKCDGLLTGNYSTLGIQIAVGV